MAVNYVKFYRGSSSAFQNTNKNSDTLYFITETDSKKGSLYLGDKLIGGNISSIADLEDILLNELSNDQILVYNEDSKKWINKSLIDAIGIMIGASTDSQGSNGLVPAPGIGQQDMFLRGDGTWAKIPVSEGIALTADEKSVSILNKTITLKDFGIKYYRFVAATETVEAHYEAQLVDATHPWVAGLQPKVVEEDGELILGWFEADPTIYNSVNEKISNVENKVNNLTSNVSSIQQSLVTVEEEVAKKADSDNIYTKTETDDKIAQAIAGAEHLKRKTFTSIEEAKQFAASTPDADKYIYMILVANTSENNQYDEYLLVEGKLEKVGGWGADLTNYATKEEVETKLSIKVDKVENHSLISHADLAKLSAIEEQAQVNKIDTVDETEFNLINKHLSLNGIAMSKVIGLENILNKKAEKTEVEEVNSKINTLESNLNIVNKKVIDLEDLLKNASYITQDELASELAPLKEAVTWQNM